jgi:hypothetical protein
MHKNKFLAAGRQEILWGPRQLGFHKEINEK